MPRNRHEQWDNGNAIMTALIALALAGVVAAALAGNARFQLLRARAYADGAKAYYRAEAGVTAALVGLPAGVTFTSIILGEDQVPATTDDGRLPYSDLVSQASAASSIELYVEDDLDEDPGDPYRDANEKILLRSIGTAGRQGRRVLLAVVGRESSPYNPAALMVIDSSIDLGDDFAADGRNHDLNDDCASLAGGPVQSGLAVAAAEALDLLGAQLALGGGSQVTGAGEPPSLSLLRPTDLGYIEEIAGDPAIDLPGGEVGGTMGDAAAPALALVRGDALVTDSLRGVGALVVLGELTITGALEFSGVMIAVGGVRIATGGRLRVCGALWSQGPLANQGVLTVDYSSEAVDMADSYLRLPRLPKLLAVREEF